MACTFCDNQDVFESRQFYKSEHWWAALDANPITPGNCMLVSTIHCASMLDAPSEALRNLGPSLQQVAQAIKEHFSSADVIAKYQELGMIDRKSPGPIRNVFVVALGEGANTKHLHFHLIPYYDCHYEERGNVEGKMMSWLGQRELLRDGGLERAILAGVTPNEFRIEASSILQLPNTAKELGKIIDRQGASRRGQ